MPIGIFSVEVRWWSGDIRAFGGRLVRLRVAQGVVVGEVDRKLLQGGLNLVYKRVVDMRLHGNIAQESVQGVSRVLGHPCFDFIIPTRNKPPLQAITGHYTIRVC